MSNISAVIVAKDNPPFLTKTLDSIQSWVGEIVVVDIGLIKEAKEKISTYKKVKIIPMDPVPYVEQIREQTKRLTKFNMLLFLDPDEIIPPTLAKILQENIEKTDYIKIPRKNIIFGKWIQHSRWWPDYQTRFFRKSAVIWPTSIHKQPQTIGNGLVLEATEQNSIEHINYSSIDEYMLKALRYAKSEARELNESGSPLTLSTIVKKSLSEFISRFFAEDGYKDGMHGFVLAMLQLLYSFLVYFYYWELKKYPTVAEKEIVESTNLFFNQGLYEVHYWENVKGLTKGLRNMKNRITNIFIK